VNHYIAYVEILELDRRTYKLRFVFVYTALAVRGFDVRQKLVFGNAGRFFEFKYFKQQFTPLRKDPRKRKENYFQSEQYRAKRVNKSFGMFLSNRFGRYFAENKHRKRHYNGGQRYRFRAVAYKAYEQHGSERRSYYIDYIVADKYRRYQLIVFVYHFSDALRPSYAVSLERVQPYPAYTRKRRFGRRKERRKENKNY